MLLLLKIHVAITTIASIDFFLGKAWVTFAGGVVGCGVSFFGVRLLVELVWRWFFAGGFSTRRIEAMDAAKAQRMAERIECLIDCFSEALHGAGDNLEKWRSVSVYQNMLLFELRELLRDIKPELPAQ